MKRFILMFLVLVLGIALAGCVKKRNQAPVIQGAVTEKTIEKGEAYDPLDGVIATDDNDGRVTVTVVGTYDVNSVGEYKFTLKAVDSAGLKDEVEITLTVVDSSSSNIPPTLIGVDTDQTYYIGSGDYNPIAGVSATDPEDGVITNSITLTGTYDLNTPGDYILTVKAVDSENATAQKTIVLHVAPSTVPNELTTDPINITFWHAFGTDKGAILQEYADEFHTLYPNITITLSSQGAYEDLRSKVSSAIVAGNQPTMLIGYPDHVSSYLMADAVEPLDQYVQNTKWGIDLSDFVQPYITENRSYDESGTLYGLPFNKSTEVLVYNKTFFDANNIPVPQTWADVKTASEKVKEVYPSTNPLYTDVYGFAYDSAANMFITLTRQWGGQYTTIDEDRKGVILFDNPETRSMLAYFDDLASKGLVALPKAWNLDYASDPFKNQKVFMTVGSIAGINYNIPANNAFEVGIAPIPQKDPDHKAVIQQGTNISIMKQASAQEKLAAWLFTKYLTSTEITTDWAMRTGYLPVRLSAFNSATYQQFLTAPQPDQKYSSMAANAAYQQRDYMFVDQPFVGSSEARVEVELLINTVLVGDVTIDAAIANALRELQ